MLSFSVDRIRVFLKSVNIGVSSATTALNKTTINKHTLQKQLHQIDIYPMISLDINVHISVQSLPANDRFSTVEEADLVFCTHFEFLKQSVQLGSVLRGTRICHTIWLIKCDYVI